MASFVDVVVDGGFILHHHRAIGSKRMYDVPRELQVFRETSSWPAETLIFSHATVRTRITLLYSAMLNRVSGAVPSRIHVYAYLPISSFGHRSRLSQWSVRPCAAASRSYSFSHHARFTRILASPLCLFMRPQVLLGRKYSSPRTYKKRVDCSKECRCAESMWRVVGADANVGPRGYELWCS